MTRRDQLRALADWIERGPTPERVRLAAMLFSGGLDAIAAADGRPRQYLDSYIAGRAEIGPHGVTGWSLSHELRPDTGPDPAEGRVCLWFAGRGGWISKRVHRQHIEIVRRDRLAARAAGWRLP